MRLIRQRGAALILVVVVIAALIAIATPFAVSMRLHEKSARGFASRVKARRLAEAARNDALAALMTSHPDEERRARIARGDLDMDDEDWDSSDELRPRSRDLKGKYTLDARSSKTTILEVETKDERGKIDLNGCNELMIGNLMGVTFLTDDVSYDDKFIPVDDISRFYSDGDPTTVDGAILVGHEIILYRDITPPDVVHHKPGGFVVASRRSYLTGGEPPNDTNARQHYHVAGTLVHDFRCVKAACDPVWRWAGTDRENELARFETPSALRKIADWELAPLMAARFFLHNGITFEKLREWGVVKEKLDLAGLDDTGFNYAGARAKEDADARKRREDAEKGLAKYGLSEYVNTIRRYGGDRAVLRAWELIDSLSEEDQKQALAKSFRDRGDKLNAQHIEHEAFWRQEVKRQLDDVIAVREKTPEIEALGRVEIERLRPFITVDSPPEGELWTDPQMVNFAVRYEPYEAYAKVPIQDARRVRVGSIARLRPVLGGKTEYRLVEAVGQDGAYPNHVVAYLFPQLELDYEESQLDIAFLCPRPININTASKEVLVAALIGLQTTLFQKVSATGASVPEYVSPQQADLIARRIMDPKDSLAGQTQIRNLTDLKKVLDDAKEAQEIDQGNETAILLNAVDPGNPQLVVGTVPFSFTSGDVYEVISTGVVNDETSSSEVAHVRTREICQVAPPRDLVWNIDCQDQLTDRLAVDGALIDPNDPRSWPCAFLSGRWGNLLETFPGDLFLKPWSKPDRIHRAQDPMKLAMSREPDTFTKGVLGVGGNDSTPGMLLLNHYDMEREGHDLPETIQKGFLAERSYQAEDNSIRFHIGPGSARAWFKVDKLGGTNNYFFDAGQGEYRDRLTCFYDTSAGAFVARVKDEALDVLETNGQPRWNAEVRFPFQIRPQNWYHVCFAWKGAERGDLAMVVDGKPVGTDMVGTRLSQQLGATDPVVLVDSTDGFPPAGFIRIGGYRNKDSTLAGDIYTSKLAVPPWHDLEPFTEVLYYSSKTQTSFILSADTTWWDELIENKHQDQAIAPGTYPPPAHLPSRRTGRYTVVPDPVDGTQMELRLGIPHDKGAPVSLWGYTLWLKNGVNWPFNTFDQQGNPITVTPKLPSYQETLHRGGATLTQPLSQNTAFTLVFMNKPPGWNAITNPCPEVVKPGQNEIPVLWADAQMGFPPTGYLRVGNERVFYHGISAHPGGGMMFTGCDRGKDGTTDDAHYLWEPVCLESIQVSDDSDYWPDPAYLVQQPQSLLDPCTYLSLTPANLTIAQHQAVMEPRQAPLVEWVRVLKAGEPQYSPHMLLPAVTPHGLRRGWSLAPGNRFVLFEPEQKRPGVIWTARWIGDMIHGRGDMRWLIDAVPNSKALINQFQQLNGNLPPGNIAQLQVGAAASPVQGKKGQPPPPPLPPRVQALKQWLMGVEPNDSRRAKNTVCDKTLIWSPAKNPLGTSAWGGRIHAVGEKVIPTFCLGSLDAGHYQYGYSGKGDIVTLVDDTQGQREEHTITWVHGAGDYTFNLPNGAGPTLGNNEFACGEIIALDDFATRPFLGSQHARIVKWPSGQLPQYLNIPGMSVGTARPPSPGDGVPDGPGTITGKIDELVSTQEDEPSKWETYVRSIHQGLQPVHWPDSSPMDAQIAAFDTCLQGEVPPVILSGGLTIKLEDELLGVTAITGGVNGPGLQVVRGSLGTAAVPHGKECTFWWNFPFPKAMVALTGFDVPKAQSFQIHPGVENNIRTKDFFVALDRGTTQTGITEIMPIKLRGPPNPDQLIRPRDWLDRGAFRGAFGSGVADPPPTQGDLLFDWPFRYQDRYNPRVNSIEGVFFQATKELPGAFFESITWEADLPNPMTKVMIAVRVDGAPSWDAEPAKKLEPGQPGKLYLFDDTSDPNKIELRGDKIEVRAYLTYKPGAFSAAAPQPNSAMGDGWKQTPVLRAIRVTYRQPTRVRRREELMD